MLTTALIGKIFLTSVVGFIIGYIILGGLEGAADENIPMILKLFTAICFIGGLIGIVASILMYIWI